MFLYRFNLTTLNIKGDGSLWVSTGSPQQDNYIVVVFIIHKYNEVYIIKSIIDYSTCFSSDFCNSSSSGLSGEKMYHVMYSQMKVNSCLLPFSSFFLLPFLYIASYIYTIFWFPEDFSHILIYFISQHIHRYIYLQYLAGIESEIREVS